MTPIRKHVNFQTMTFEQVVAYFSKENSKLEASLRNQNEQGQVDDELNKYLGTMWEDELHDIRLASDIRAYLLVRGLRKEDLNLTNTQKAYQRYLITNKKRDLVAVRHAWSTRIRTKLSRLFRRR